MNDILLLYTVFIISILLHIVAALGVAFLIIPIQIREAKVQDELTHLRKLLLYFGIWVVAVAIVSVLALTVSFFIPPPIVRYVVSALIFIHALGFLSFFIIGFRIYHSPYPDKGKSIFDIVRGGENHD